jgi:hypothetical protein
MWAALDPQATVPGWSSAAFPKAVVGLSGIYDLPLRNPMPSQQFINDVDIYTNSPESFVGWETQLNASPIKFVDTATNIPPVRLYATQDNSVPPEQSENMRDALRAHDPNADVIEYTMEGSEHAFGYWHMVNNVTGECVSAEIIAFLQDQL